MDFITINVEVSGDTATVRVIGELDMAASHALENAALGCLKGPQIKDLTLDFERVTFMDLSGLHAIERIAYRVTVSRGRLVICRASDPVTRVLALRRQWTLVEPWRLESLPRRNVLTETLAPSSCALAGRD
jgi:anti-anti-sigma factor